VDAPGPLLRDLLLEPDAGAQPDEGVEVPQAVAGAHHRQSVFDDEPGRDRLGRRQAARPSNDTGQRIIAENVEASS
jgi:hypothetical protein